MVPSRGHYRSLGDPVIAKGVGYGLSCVRCVQLHEYPLDMPFDSAVREVEELSDLPCRLSVSNPGQYVCLSFC